MSVFRNVRIWPSHGTRSATITWDLATGTDAGDVYVAFSHTGTQGSWDAKNSNAPVPSATGMYQDTDLVINAGTLDGFYRLMLVTPGGGDNEFSEPIQILGDLTPREYGIVRAIVHQEFTQMRVCDGFPVWHCIPRMHGTPSDKVDPDTGKVDASECDDEGSEGGDGDGDADTKAYGMAFEGGFYPPVLTWMRVIQHAEGLQDDPDEFSPHEIDKTSVRLLPFPRPRRNHMLVDPTNDRRYLVGQEIKPVKLRGVIPVIYTATLEFLQQGDERYKFQTPEIDTKAYRKIPYWTPTTLE